ncbi:Glycogen synthase [Candidatus Nitrosocosmicus oleophilus]|uniref:Glycogen synthase n=1 Tax=Candidatus Nitrosocosmicus oleophilus TaxID=1353260 RepID=A0A654M1E8_9ARCH|nr:glycosyltransferase family 4 protein [Candidatus Nitrosocosmicus oleophilus]ALI37568.1 Glycogen synthase [Candidatus Nitrosocosmicus oleophilus]
MRILWFNWRDIRNPEAGGAEVLTHEISSRLVKKGHDITLFTSSFQDCSESDVIDGVSVVRKGGKFSVYREAKKYYKIHKNKFDLIIDEINVKPFLTPKYVKELPIIGLIHQISPEQFTTELPFPIGIIGRYFLEKKWLSYYRDILTITVSNSTRISLEELGYNRVRVIKVGLSIKQLPEPLPKEDQITVTYIGRLKKHKLPDHAILAFKKILESFPESQMYVIGNGYMIKKLKQIDVKNITFFGHIDDKQKYELIARSHLVLMPATREGWGLVVIESNAMGTPVIAYKVPGLVDSVQNGINGLLVEKNTPDELASMAVSLLKDPIKLLTLSRSSLDYAKNFNWDNTVSEFEKIIMDG